MLPVKFGVEIVPLTWADVVVIDATLELVVTVGAVGLSAVGQLAPSFGDLIAAELVVTSVATGEF